MNNMQRVPILFEDLSFNSQYEFIEEGKESSELKEMLIKKGVPYPSKDLAIFKGRYAMIDKANKNKCTLPKKEVKKAIKTLAMKAIDKDHFRRNTIGVWLDAELDGDEILSYGLLWKNNFEEEYAEIKDRMQKGKMKISFEAWGDRVFKENGGYDLTNIEFAGGALLFETDPAFPEAEVLEMSNRVLEFAKVIEDVNKEKFIESEAKKLVEEHKGNEVVKEKMEEAKFHFIPQDCMIIDKFLWDTPCPSCQVKGMYNVSSIDFDKSETKVDCIKCGAKYTLNLEPDVTVDKKGKKIKDLIKANETKIDTKGGIDKVDELLKKYNKATIEEVVSFLEKEIDVAKSITKEVEDGFLKSIEEAAESLKACMNTKIKDGISSKDAFKECIKMMKSSLDEEIATLKSQLKVFEDEKATQEKAKRDELIKSRKDELGDFAKDMKDEDILDEVKYENAKLKKENAELKKTNPAKGGLEAGAQVDETHKPAFEAQKRIQEGAWKE